MLPMLTIESDWKLQSFNRAIDAAQDRDGLRDAMIAAIESTRMRVKTARSLTSEIWEQDERECVKALDEIQEDLGKRVTLSSLQSFSKDAMGILVQIDQAINHSIRRTVMGEINTLRERASEILCRTVGSTVPKNQHPDEWLLDPLPEIDRPDVFDGYGGEFE